MKSQIMYIEAKRHDVTGLARIGRVTTSKSGKTLYYGGRSYGRLGGQGFKANYFDEVTGEEYWISRCKSNGGDRLYPGTIVIDDDVRDEYWTDIRKMPEQRHQRVIRCPGKYGGKKGKSY